MLRRLSFELDDAFARHFGKEIFGADIAVFLPNWGSLDWKNASPGILALTEVGKDLRFVFVGHDGKPMDHWGTPPRKGWTSACKEADIKDFRWHDLRHTWASWHVQQGTPLYVLKELGGWETLEIVKRYAHLAPEHLKEYAERINFGATSQIRHKAVKGESEVVA